MAVFSAIAAVFSAVPIFDAWLKSFVAWYASTQYAAFKAEDRAAIEKALDTFNQIGLEQAIGSTISGEHSNDPGTSVVDSLPGVPK